MMIVDKTSLALFPFCRGKHSPQVVATARWKKLSQDEEDVNSDEEKETTEEKEAETTQQDEAR